MITTESASLVRQEMEALEMLLAWGPPVIAQSACSICKMGVCVLFTTAGTKSMSEKQLSPVPRL